MDIRDSLWTVAAGIGGFVGGVLTNILKMVMPSYVDLSKRNDDLQKENDRLREIIEGLEDSLDDETGQ